MFRNVLRLFAVLVGALILRQVVLFVIRLLSPGAEKPAPQVKTQQSQGELKKDPVCGTFVAVSSSIKGTVDGQVVHFCSTTCRDRYGVV